MEEVVAGITADDVEEAALHVQGRVHRTPLLKFEAFQGLAGAQVYVKAENLQKTGSFKIRGAYNKLCQLAAGQKERGVVTASAGNHAQGVAVAARWLGIPCVVVMPEGAPITKVVATRSYGAEVVLYGDSYDQAYDRARDIERERGLAFIHAFDDPQVIAGQGTVGLEILEQLPDVDVLIVPVGGGGLICGVALAVKAHRPGVRVIGVQPEGAAAVYRSRQAGQVVEIAMAKTIADGLAVKRPRERTLDLMERLVDDMVLVNEDEIARAVLLFMERGKLVIEGAGAVGLAALLSGRLELPGLKTVLIASGGNIDVNLLARIIDHALVQEGRYVRVLTTVPDRPGGLHRLLGAVVAAQGNVISVGHDRLQPGVPLGETEVMLTLEARDRTHVEEILDRIRSAGYSVRVM